MTVSKYLAKATDKKEIQSILVNSCGGESVWEPARLHPQSKSKWSCVHVSNGNVLITMRKGGGYGLPSPTRMGSTSFFCHQPACVSLASSHDSCIFSFIVFVLPPCSLYRGTFLSHVTVVHSSMHFGDAQILPCTPKGSPSQLEPLCPFLFPDLTAPTSASLFASLSLQCQSIISS